ncbi:MAG: hypothetical protein ABJN14_23500 [Paracoccaceae bacterium]
MGELKSAREIAEYLLERSGSSIMDGDFETFKTCFALPQYMDTFEGRRFIETIEDIRDIFDNVREYYQSKSVVELNRICVEASFRDAHTVVSTHEARMISKDAVLVQSPYPVFSILRLYDDGWKVAYSQVAIADEPKHNQALRGVLDT